MRPSEIIASFPERVPASLPHPAQSYAKRPGCAVHNRPFDTPAPDAILLLNDGQIAAYPGEPPPGELEWENIYLTAVYAQPPSGLIAIPTGMVFIRFRSGVVAESRREELRQAGYEIREALSYAPQAAWVGAHSGNAAEALARVSSLEGLRDIERIEPQMLIEPAHKPSR